MSVHQVVVCEWTSRAKRGTVLANPAWDAIQQAIENLNNENFNDLYIQPTADDPETYLVIGGGGGRYLVTGSIANERFPTVVDPLKSSENRELLVVGGQEVDYPARWLVDLDTALRAAKHFYNTNLFEGGGLTWEDV